VLKCWTGIQTEMGWKFREKRRKSEGRTRDKRSLNARRSRRKHSRRKGGEQEKNGKGRTE
jgi:hypothetical protein